MTPTTTPDNLANVPYPAGAIIVSDWYDADSPDCARCFAGTSWVVERDERDRDLEVDINGVQHRDGSIERIIALTDGATDAMPPVEVDTFTVAEARQLAAALIAAVDEAEKMDGYDQITVSCMSTVPSGCRAPKRRRRCSTRWRIPKPSTPALSDSGQRRQEAADCGECVFDAAAGAAVHESKRVHAMHGVHPDRPVRRVVVVRIPRIHHRLQHAVDLIHEAVGHTEVAQRRRQREMIDGDHVRRRRRALGVDDGPDVLRGYVGGGGERGWGVPDGSPEGGVGDGYQIRGPVGEVGETVVCGEDLVRVVLGLAVNLFRHRVVDDGDVAAGREETGQEALPETLVPCRVAEHGELKLVPRRCVGVVH